MHQIFRILPFLNLPGLAAATGLLVEVGISTVGLDVCESIAIWIVDLNKELWQQTVTSARTPFTVGQSKK